MKLTVILSAIILAASTPAIAQRAELMRELPTPFGFAFDADGGYLGVQTSEVTKENFGKHGLRDVRGVVVEKVMENSPAANAGLKSGDVIVRFNGEPITSSRKLTRLVGEVEPDHQVKLTVSRGGSEQEITATVAKRPAASFGEGNFRVQGPNGGFRSFDLPELKGLEKLKDGPNVFTFPEGKGESFIWRSGTGREIGASVYNVTKQLGERFGVDGGVMLNEVRSDSPAAKAGLKAGDIITEVDGKAVKSNLDLIKSINLKKEGDVQLTIVRDKNRQTVTVTPEVSKGGGFLFQTDGNDGL